MAEGIEFTSRVGKVFTQALLKSSSYALLETITDIDEVTPGRYQIVTNRSGVVWMEATAGATKAYGWANLDRPALNGYAEVRDSLAELDSATIANQEAILATLTSGSVQPSAPVTTTGTIPNIIIGDDYKAASGRAFNWTVAVPAFSLSGSKCYFGGFAKHKGQWLVEGTITPITVDSVPKWQLSFELDEADTEACLPGCYDWSVELRGPDPEQITKIIGTTELLKAYTR
jgi:hypothetical protein